MSELVGAALPAATKGRRRLVTPALGEDIVATNVAGFQRIAQACPATSKPHRRLVEGKPVHSELSFTRTALKIQRTNTGDRQDLVRILSLQAHSPSDVQAASMSQHSQTQSSPTFGLATTKLLGSLHVIDQDYRPRSSPTRVSSSPSLPAQWQQSRFLINANQSAGVATIQVMGVQAKPRPLNAAARQLVDVADGLTRMPLVADYLNADVGLLPQLNVESPKQVRKSRPPGGAKRAGLLQSQFSTAALPREYDAQSAFLLQGVAARVAPPQVQVSPHINLAELPTAAGTAVKDEPRQLLPL